MKRKLATIAVAILSTLSPLKIGKSPPGRIPKPCVAELQAYDPLTADILDLYGGMRALDSAGMGKSYDELYNLLKNKGFDLPYSPPQNRIIPEKKVFPIPIENADITTIVVEKSERAYILYQLLTGRKNVSRLGINEMRYAFRRETFLLSGHYGEIDTIDLSYVLKNQNMACLEFAVLCASILFSYGYEPEINILFIGTGGHAVVVLGNTIMDDEFTGSKKAMLEHYKREWGEYDIINLSEQKNK